MVKGKVKDKEGSEGYAGAGVARQAAFRMQGQAFAVAGLLSGVRGLGVHGELLRLLVVPGVFALDVPGAKCAKGEQEESDYHLRIVSISSQQTATGIQQVSGEKCRPGFRVEFGLAGREVGPFR